MSLDIVLGKSIIAQQSCARISPEIIILLEKCKREVRVKDKVKVKGNIKVS